MAEARDGEDAEVDEGGGKWRCRQSVQQADENERDDVLQVVLVAPSGQKRDISIISDLLGDLYTHFIVLLMRYLVRAEGFGMQFRDWILPKSKMGSNGSARIDG